MVQSAFGFVARGLWSALDARWAGSATSAIFPIAPLMHAMLKFFGRFKHGAIRDGVLLAIDDSAVARVAVAGAWSCDSDDALAAFDADLN